MIEKFFTISNEHPLDYSPRISGEMWGGCTRTVFKCVNVALRINFLGFLALYLPIHTHIQSQEINTIFGIRMIHIF